MGVSMYCFILLVSAARIDGRINRRCTFGGFSSIVNAALKRILQEYVLLLRNSSKLGINHYFLDQRKARTYHAPDIASELAARGLVSGKERAL